MKPSMPVDPTYTCRHKHCCGPSRRALRLLLSWPCLTYRWVMRFRCSTLAWTALRVFRAKRGGVGGIPPTQICACFSQMLQAKNINIHKGTRWSTVKQCCKSRAVPRATACLFDDFVRKGGNACTGRVTVGSDSDRQQRQLCSNTSLRRGFTSSVLAIAIQLGKKRLGWCVMMRRSDL